MADGFDEHRDQVKNFEDDLVDQCYDIIDASYDSSNAYFVTQPDVLDGRYAAPDEYVEQVRAANPTPQPSDYDNEEFNHANFRDDISDLAQVELPIFLDGGADPSQFDEVVERLGRAADNLEMASGYTGLQELITLIDKWEGDAAYNFQRSVIPSYGVSIVYQLVFMDDLIATAMCLKEVVERTRGDALGLAQELHGKIVGDGTAVPLDTILWVAGSIAAGIATFGVTGPVTASMVASMVAFPLNTASAAIGHVQKLTGGDTGDRTIEGETAYDFIPSCLERIKEVLDKGRAEVTAVMDALKSDLSGEGADFLCISKPQVIDAAETIAGTADNDQFALLDAASNGHDFIVDAIADLRYAGVVTLPTMAYYFDKAYGEVANLSDPFAAGIGSSPVLTGNQNHLAAAIDAIGAAFKDTRDYLYRAGVALKDIADAYFETEAEHEEMMNNFTTQLEAYEAEGVLPTYAPQAPSPNTDR